MNLYLTPINPPAVEWTRFKEIALCLTAENAEDAEKKIKNKNSAVSASSALKRV
jgi:hypothetical protein